MRGRAIRDIVLCSLFAALIIVGTFIKVPSPLVPFTLQTLFTNLAGLLLGRRRGMISVLIYILLGLVGLPVFTGGGGIGYVLQPTFGYIIGFLFGAGLGGHIAFSSKKRSFKLFFLAGLANMAVVYAFGLLYFYLISHLYLGTKIGIGVLFLNCFALTFPFDVVLCALAALLAKRMDKITDSI
ncbi:MAG: biotin transporter BioY [Clostridiales bacterium]|nr:biotin transporter BioY [Clostridiales bacterium]